MFINRNIAYALARFENMPLHLNSIETATYTINMYNKSTSHTSVKTYLP